ncbi:MAG TPA: MMPL family transporter [Thermoanaerobaculia bacterium]|nr:MMPL family transporter [Thermoanaerobaculia bacterium]HXK66973.1 MMPL family transporter [Thermoanaerobaculia bacterium]
MQFLIRHYRKVAFATVLITIGCVFIIPGLQIETDIVKQMPQDNKVFETFRHAVEDVGTLDVFLIILRLDPDSDMDTITHFADELAVNVERLPDIRRVEYRLPDPLAYYGRLLPHLMAMSSDEEWEAVRARLETGAIERNLALVKSRLQTPLSGTVKGWLRNDPLNFLEIFQDRLTQDGQGFSLDFGTGYFLSGDHRFLILIARPMRPAQDILFSRELVREVKEVEERTLGEFRKSQDLPEFQVTIEHGGGYVIAIEDGAIVKSDMLRNMATSFIGVLILFLFAFRRYGSLIFAAIPIAVGMLLTFTFATLVMKEVNAASSAFAALLIGLAIDFIIVTYARYIEERGHGIDCEGACRLLSRTVYPPIFIGAITTAATFASFGVTTLPGLRELGLLTSTGILICMATIFILLPTMLLMDAGKKRVSRLYLHSFGSDQIVRFSIRHTWIILIGSIVITIVCIYLAVGIPFIDDANTMRSPDNRGVVLRKELAESFGTTFSPMMVLVEAPSEDELVERNSRLKDFLNQLKSEGVITGHAGLYQLLPSISWQQENIERRKSEFTPEHVEEIRRVFTTTCQKLELNVGVFETFLGTFSKTLENPTPITIASLPEHDPLIQQFIRRSEGKVESIVSIYPPQGMWRREPPPTLESWIDKQGEGMTLTGVNVLSREIRTIARRDAFRATVLGFVLVFILLYLDFKKLSLTFFSLIPLVFGILWMLGTMRLLDIPLNSMNIFVIAMIIGIGVDYGIHVVHRYMEGKDDPWASVARTGNAIIVAALSTMIGFGTLTMSHFPGLRSMGLLAILGAAYCALASLTVFPVFIKVAHLFRRDNS